MTFLGIPSDYQRGLGASYIYANNTVPITEDEYMSMLMLRARGDDKNSRAIMDNMDTIVYKYSIGKDIYDQDANYNIYRAGSIHLYLAETYVFWEQIINNIRKPSTFNAVGYLNDGSSYETDANRPQLGVRGRVGLANGYDKKDIRAIRYFHDPYTNKITGYTELVTLEQRQQFFEEDVILERALETAYEGERFYDLIRVAKRRNDPSFLAKKVAAKYPSYMQDQIESYLMDENNWYINYFDNDNESE